jgi:hypothetical protein
LPYYITGQAKPYDGFSKGIDRDSPRTRIAEGHYEDAKNMLLVGQESGQHVATMQVDAELDPTITWQPGNIVWFAPFTYATFNSTTGILTFETHLLLQRDTGAFWRYDFGNPGTETLVRRISKAAVQEANSFVYDQWLVFLNGRDAPLKYGQHFRFDTQGHEVPYLFPLGSKPVTPNVPSITGETWTFGGASAFVADASVPGGGARVGTHSLKLAVSQTARVTFATTKNFVTGPRPYGGTDFTTTDFHVDQYYKAANAGSFDVRYYKTFPGVYAQFNTATPATGAWTNNPQLRSAATFVGGFVAGDFATITDVEYRNNDAVNEIYLDDTYFLYANAPPAAAVGTAHKDRIVLGGAPVSGPNNDPTLSTVFYSPAAKPDEFPSTNSQIISGGATSLSRTNRITVLREYGDSVIVGTQNAMVAWTIGTDGVPSRSVITTETGMDSPHAVVETPTGSLLFNWQRGIYLLRQTGRNFISQKIAPLLKNIWLEEPWWTAGIRDEKTRTIRFWFRELHDTDTANPSTTTSGVVFDYVRAQDSGDAVWSSRMDQLADYVAEAYIDGVRETLYTKYTSPKLYLMGANPGGVIESSVTMPWLMVETGEAQGRWIGCSVPYASTAEVRVFARYANHPGQFESAPFEEIQVLPSNPDQTVPGQVQFGKTARYIQIKFQAQTYGFELFPPITLREAATTKYK